MTTVSIHVVSLEAGKTAYRAVLGEYRSFGKSAGEALDLLTAQLDPSTTGTLVVLQRNVPDAYFTAEQKEELEDLMSRWRAARDQGIPLSREDQSRLDILIDAEVKASGERAAALADELGR